MKIAISIITFLFVIISLNVFAQNSNARTEKDFYGTWVTKVNEPIDGKCKIEVEWKSDNTTSILFKYKNGMTINHSSKWKYKHPNYEEVFPDGIIGKATIDWINDNKFKLTIVENQDTENYKGRVRVYKRKNSSK
jgi:hypothetical protein